MVERGVEIPKQGAVCIRGKEGRGRGITSGVKPMVTDGVDGDAPPVLPLVVTKARPGLRPLSPAAAPSGGLWVGLVAERAAARSGLGSWGMLPGPAGCSGTGRRSGGNDDFRGPWRGALVRAIGTRQQPNTIVRRGRKRKRRRRRRRRYAGV